MKKNLTMGSLFDGSGGFPLAASLNGIVPIWSSEIEPYPIKVTSKRFPFMKHYGDINTISGKEIEPVDIITFGSPCQDMSLAGKRKGMNRICEQCNTEFSISLNVEECPHCGEKVSKTRSGLFVEAIRIIKEMREATNGKYPTFIIWENVPGAYSSNKGNDFRTVLEEICSIKSNSVSIPEPPKQKWLKAGEIVGDNYSIAWRTLDAQYWGVPQRRRRIYLVADFAGQRASKILFKSCGLSWNTAKSGSEKQGTAANIKNCPHKSVSFRPGATARIGSPAWEDVSGTLCSSTGDNQMAVVIVSGKQQLYENHGQDVRYKGPLKIAPTITASYNAGNNQSFVVNCIQGSMIGRDNKNGPQGSGISKDVCFTLNTIDRHAVSALIDHSPIPYGISSYCSNAMLSGNPKSGIYEADTSKTIDGNGMNPGCNQGGIAVVCVDQGAGKSNCTITEELSPTLACSHDGAPAVVSLDRASFNQGKNAKFGIGIDSTGKSHTLVSKGPGAVSYSMTTGNFMNVQKEKASTLAARDYKDPQSVLPASFYPQMKAESMSLRNDGVSNTIVNGTNPGFQNGILESNYIVRRITPLECSRLQGFPDWWTDGLEIEELTESDMEFWKEVFETHRKVVSGAAKPKTDNQIRKWLKEPTTDGHIYKMWGNGIALPCAYAVFSGIISVISTDL